MKDFWLTPHERICLEFLGERGTVSADDMTIGRAILGAIDPDEWGWTGSFVAGSLASRGLVEARGIMWAITPAGRAELRSYSESPNESTPVERYALAETHEAR